MLRTPYTQSPLAARGSLPQRQFSSPHIPPVAQPPPPPEPSFQQLLPPGAVAGPSQRNRRGRVIQDNTERKCVQSDDNGYQSDSDASHPSAASYLRPPSPTSRLLLALQSPLKSEVSWALSRLIHASFIHPEHLILSQWCGLAQRLLDLVHRFNSAARRQAPMGWDEYEEHQQKTLSKSLDSDSDSDDDEDADHATALVKQGSTASRQFDARTNDDHYFMLNAAVSASLILRNTCEQQENALWLTGQPELLKVAYEAVSLPEDLFGFEPNVKDNGPSKAAYQVEEEMRFEGVREMRLYWVEILRAVAHRMKLFNPTDVVRFDDGIATRSTLASSQTATVLGTTAAGSATPSALNSQPAMPTPSTRIHSSDQIFTHATLLLHSTSDQALLLATLRFLAQLISNAKARPELFIEREVTLSDSQGSSPGIVGRCRELLPLAGYNHHPLAEAILDCLDAAVDVAVDVTDVAAGAEDEEGPLDDNDAQIKIRRVYPNALSVVTARIDQQPPSGSTTQPAIGLLSHFLSLSATFWERSEPLKLHSALHPAHVIPSQLRYRQEAFQQVPWFREEDTNWHRLRALKEQSGLVDYVTEREKRRIETLEEPARLDAWLRLVTRPVGDGHRQDNTHYVTQMHIWTSYRDTFDPLVKRAATENRTMPGLMAAADVISRVTELFPTTSAVLVMDEDRRLPPNTQKFVIRGLEGYRRPEVIKWICRWRGCPLPKTDSKEALLEHMSLHVGHSKAGRRCEWSTCAHRVLESEVADNDAARSQLREHVKTHLPSDDQPKDDDKKEAEGVKPPALQGLSPPAKGRFVPVRPLHKPDDIKKENGSDETAARGNAHPHAKSASQPSRYTFDRPSSITYRVYRTPFDQERNMPEGPAYACARILKRIAEMCRETLGEDDGSTVDESQLVEGDEGKKRLKLDFSDRLDQNRFGSPFYLPANFQKTWEEEQRRAARAAAGLVVGTEARSGANTPAVTVTDVASGVQSTAQSTPTPAPQASAQTLAKQKSTQALQELLSVEENLLRWAGCNDILCPTLMETLDSIHRTRGVRIGSVKRKAAPSVQSGAAAGDVGR